MISTVKKGIVAVAEILHLKLFQHEMSDQMRKFLRHLSWSILGGISASAVMMAVNIIAGRLMGPDEYGKYSLLLTLAQMIIIPMLFGLDVSTVIAISKSEGIQEKKSNISSSLYFVIVSGLILSILFIISSPYLSRWSSMGMTFYNTVFIFAIVTGLKNILDSFIRGLHLFKYQFYGKIGEVVFVSLSFFLFFGLEKKHDYFNYILSLGVGIFFLIVYYLKRILPYLSSFDVESLKKQLSLAKILVIGTVLGIGFNSIDKLIVAKYLSLVDLGIYSAYYMVSINLVAQLIQMFINVFLPSISGIDNDNFVKKIDKVYSLGFLPVFISLVGIIFVAIKLFGDKYGLNFGLVISFSLLSTLQIYLTINSTIITAISKETYKRYLLYLNSVNFIHIIVYILMIVFHAVSVQLILILYIINVIILIIIQKRLIRTSFAQITNTIKYD